MTPDDGEDATPDNKNGTVTPSAAKNTATEKATATTSSGKTPNTGDAGASGWILLMAAAFAALLFAYRARRN